MNPHMSVHFTGKAGYIGHLSIPETARESLVDANGPKANQKPQVFFILDRSGSMGQWVGRMVTTVIPLIAEQNLGISPEDELTLITFDAYTEKIITTVKGLQGLNMRARGCTHMEGVFSQLLESVNVTSNPSIVIVAISDGEVQDQAQTLVRAHEAAAMLKGCCSISASAICLMTSSYSQPDTRALASVLQLNTDYPGSIIDLPATDAKHSNCCGVAEFCYTKSFY